MLLARPYPWNRGTKLAGNISKWYILCCKIEVCNVQFVLVSFDPLCHASPPTQIRGFSEYFDGVGSLLRVQCEHN